MSMNSEGCGAGKEIKEVTRINKSKNVKWKYRLKNKSITFTYHLKLFYTLSYTIKLFY